jgi:hypothetical protein
MDIIYEIYIDFYKYVDKIIYNIHCNEFLQNYMFYCKYTELGCNNKHELPLTILLGGSGYIAYSNIFNDCGLDYKLDNKTLDYDVSFSINKLIDKKSKFKFVKQVEIIINEAIIAYKYKDYNKSIFSLDFTMNDNRIHIRLNANIDNKDFHILELSFWLNGKISDNFTVNDFMNDSLVLYNSNKVYYYLLPLDLLVKTTFYAILDFFEKRNFSKCNKYIERITYLHKIYILYNKSDTKNEILFDILDPYKTKIKRKYKIIKDYPFIISKYLYKINNNGIIKCIYRHLRDNNHSEIKKLVSKYKDKCKNKSKYNESEITLIETEDY